MKEGKDILKHGLYRDCKFVSPWSCEHQLLYYYIDSTVYQCGSTTVRRVANTRGLVSYISWDITALKQPTSVIISNSNLRSQPIYTVPLFTSKWQPQTPLKLHSSCSTITPSPGSQHCILRHVTRKGRQRYKQTTSLTSPHSKLMAKLDT